MPSATRRALAPAIASRRAPRRAPAAYLERLTGRTRHPAPGSTMRGTPHPARRPFAPHKSRGCPAHRQHRAPAAAPPRPDAARYSRPALVALISA
ncbi:hypothetical protein [Streptomyces sp. 11-1-2]|uniref:hypothetical protein n=1 Tax=unclassified Streptomyces TaxID=2593676 RepID=UPI0013C4FC57|nr:hypothetical protein [Streptomyces sp. 11-1-2]